MYSKFSEGKKPKPNLKQTNKQIMSLNEMDCESSDEEGKEKNGDDPGFFTRWGQMKDKPKSDDGASSDGFFRRRGQIRDNRKDETEDEDKDEKKEEESEFEDEDADQSEYEDEDEDGDGKKDESKDDEEEKEDDVFVLSKLHDPSFTDQMITNATKDRPETQSLAKGIPEILDEWWDKVKDITTLEDFQKTVEEDKKALLVKLLAYEKKLSFSGNFLVLEAHDYYGKMLHWAVCNQHFSNNQRSKTSFWQYLRRWFSLKKKIPQANNHPSTPKQKRQSIPPVVLNVADLHAQSYSTDKKKKRVVDKSPAKSRKARKVVVTKNVNEREDDEEEIQELIDLSTLKWSDVNLDKKRNEKEELKKEVEYLKTKALELENNFKEFKELSEKKFRKFKETTDRNFRVMLKVMQSAGLKFDK